MRTHDRTEPEASPSPVGGDAALGAGKPEGADAPQPKAAPSRRRGSRLLDVLPVIGLCLGLVLLVVPIALDLYDSWVNEHTISTLTDQAGQSDEAARWLAQADAYNRVLAGAFVGHAAEGGSSVDESDVTAGDVVASGEFGSDAAASSEAGGSSDAAAEAADAIADADVLPYEQQLGGADGSPVAWVAIPSISVRLPIYLGTSDAVLSSGVGHVEGTSLPVGGASTHCVLTGHSGLYDSRMFDDIRELEPGDLFAVHTMGRTCTYEVTGSATVLPTETDSLAIREGEDLCTLVTCTPYGVNDHRLLVYGRRTDRTIPQQGSTASNVVASVASRPRLLPLLLGVAIAAVGLVAVLVAGRRRSRRRAGKKGSAHAPAHATDRRSPRDG